MACDRDIGARIAQRSLDRPRMQRRDMGVGDQQHVAPAHVREQLPAIAKQAYKDGRPVLDVAVEMTGLPEKRLRKLLDPASLTRGGVTTGGGGGGG